MASKESSERLVFDPDGDLLLRFTCPVEEDEQEGDVANDHPQSYDDDGPLLPWIGDPSPLDEDKRHPEDPEEPHISVPGEDASTEETDAVLVPDAGLDGTSCPSVENGPPLRTTEMLVSSKHLMLVSPVFKAMFTHRFKEGETLRSNGHVEVELDDETYAFEILMDIIHCRIRKIPGHVSLQTLASLSIIVDKYQTLEPVELHVRLWLPELKKEFPTSMSPEVLPWLSIAWVFQLDDDFMDLTRIVQRESFAGWNAGKQCYPMPDRIYAKVEEQRQACIDEALSLVENYISIYQNSSKSICRVLPRDSRLEFACDSMVLGSLLKSATQLGLWPRTSSMYHNSSVSKTLERITALEIVSLCRADSLRPDIGYDFDGISFPSCTKIKRTIHRKLNAIENRLVGLSLDF
ncbi:uncharacterized protein L3040_005625 [Drepanopeziza brunnea f. sp. 'multigermtubi']|uniref:uncharacterized protein n=1 Tax=Drepanopeziza brunnea f. sp. 'multigermtubi' TaxID=698441 RepID=UPI00239922FE|nr:hypothetical protein L3040_005625 [Drepanopeziza brunnea f. sp. 'multigermtubi']